MGGCSCPGFLFQDFTIQSFSKQPQLVLIEAWPAASCDPKPAFLHDYCGMCCTKFPNCDRDVLVPCPYLTVYIVQVIFLYDVWYFSGAREMSMTPLFPWAVCGIPLVTVYFFDHDFSLC